MNVIHLKYPYQLDKVDPSTSYSLAVGFFDGVHKGHQVVIKTAMEKARELNVKSAVMTFDPHPSIVLGNSNEKIFYITPLPLKLEILEEMGVDTTFVVQFTSDFAKLSPEEFIQYFIRDLNIKHVTAGFDFSFGAFGKGNMELMKKLSRGDFGVTVVDKQIEDGEKISSTRIRKCLREGDMETVHQLLGRPYQVPGIVVQGDKRGRTIGFPTANIQSKEGCFIPKVGVYAVKVLVQNQLYNGICNVGFKPTFKNPEEKQLTIEVHILDFQKNIYGEEVKVYWYKRLRDEQKFDGIESLKAQITRDKEQAIEFFSKK
ncbi:riboflavin biosynthesis protein RibF [Ureibacillus sp. FSL K6-8385]|uniref:Riboflavin biosynthesis protein n=1 Tax=Ureibacillus terrenus TaxID=118246 RepID=A0A540V670_9BACL|nr:riboflavin biosynthesis protein RibF [Ureibacillus terrenus]MED3660445.1 riboflavin biosynthesis protein RibF [Ureibacillus terrenus]MED3762600.1 riboflavin biosynthesis protein RibF [Ureibacillus terrenus]TQE91663.1 riboflavin biosynthesis protein RibF [Ureibacillus terrenus]